MTQIPKKTYFGKRVKAVYIAENQNIYYAIDCDKK